MLVFSQKYVELVLKDIFREIASQDVEGRFLLLQPAVSSQDPVRARSGKIPDVQFYTDIKAVWQESIVGSASTVWDVDPSLILVSHGYCAEVER